MLMLMLIIDGEYQYMYIGLKSTQRNKIIVESPIYQPFLSMNYFLTFSLSKLYLSISKLSWLKVRYVLLYSLFKCEDAFRGGGGCVAIHE